MTRIGIAADHGGFSLKGELAESLRRAVENPESDGCYVNRRFWFLDGWLRHCGYYPSWNLRLFRHKLGRYEEVQTSGTVSGDNEVHEHVVLRGATAQLKNDMLHYAYPDIYTWMEKHNRYSNWEAEVEVSGNQGSLSSPATGGKLSVRRKLRIWSRRLPFRPSLRFIYSYILKRGFLDGRAGYMFCRLLATYEMLNVFKAYERRNREKNHTS
jgi:hypothetical protein